MSLFITNGCIAVDRLKPTKTRIEKMKTRTPVGFTLVELLVAIAIIAIVIAGCAIRLADPVC